MQRQDIGSIGCDWLVDMIGDMPDHIDVVTPVIFNEQNRYLPSGVSPRPGYIRYDLFPFLKEIIDCFDVVSDVREVNLMKGVQVGYTTLLESVMLYYIAHVKTKPLMFITADKELASSRMDNNIIPMINESGFSHLIRSADDTSQRKTGKTKDYIQWDGGGFMMYNGALNAAKMRQTSVAVMLKDELDGWKRSVGQDGNSDSLTDARLSVYWTVRKILRGSTPLLEPSLIGEAYERGDKRKYMVLCRKCNYPQELRQQAVNEETGEVGGFLWETLEGSLINESVRYACVACGHEHYEHDKEKLFASEEGAFWQPTVKAKTDGVRSYHLPAFYSPFGFRPWYKCISDYLESYDSELKQVKSISKFQEYYNNTLGMPFKVLGSKIQFIQVSGHRRSVYRLGQVPNEYARKYSGSKILFLTCQVDVHKRNLAVAVMGWCRDGRCYLIDYWRFEKDADKEDCTEPTSSVWQKLKDLIEIKKYEADDGTLYKIALTFIDSGYATDTVYGFCSDYASGVYPIAGRDRPFKGQAVKEFAEFKTRFETIGYRILVDHYKDRLASVLKRDWFEDKGTQKIYHFNAPMDTTDKQLKELTVETQQERIDDKGNTTFVWYRSGGVNNELWDLLVYGHAAMELIAYNVCIKNFKLETIDWCDFWDFAEDKNNCQLFARYDIVV